MSRALILLLSILLACSSKKTVEDPTGTVPQDQLVLKRKTRGGTSAAAKAPAAWFDEQLRIIDKEIAAGEFEAAIRRAFALRDKRPGALHRAQLDQLMQKANMSVLDLPTLEASFEAIDEPIEFGDPVRVRVRLHNLGRRPIMIPARLEGTSDSVFELVLVRREWDTRAQVVTSTRRFSLPLERDWEIPAGGTSEQILDLGPFGNDKGLNGFRVFAVRGRLRPARLDMGDLRRWDSIPISACYLRSFRSNWNHLADDPLRRVIQAVQKSASTHLLTAVALLPVADKRDAVDYLVGELRGDRVIDWAILASLEYLTRIELGRDTNAWRAWWPRVRDTYFDGETDMRKGPAFEVGR